MCENLKILFFDLETTGVNPEKNAIHQLSGIIEINGEVKEKFDLHVRPSDTAIIEQKALDVSGVTKEQIMQYPLMEDVYKQFTDMLYKYIDKYDKTDKFFLAGYNNSAFDNQFLREFFLQNGDRYFGSLFWSNSIDVMSLSTLYLIKSRQRMPNFKLSTVAEYMGISLENIQLHDAMNDIYLTREIYKKICQNYK